MKQLIVVFQCDAFNHSWKKFQLADTHNHAESSGIGSLKPDLLLYGKDNVKECYVGGDAYRSHFGFAELFVEVKKDKSRDPFKDPTNPEEAIAGSLIAEFKGKQRKESAIGTIGQIVSYATELCARQHRTHCFSISIYGQTARLIRWDRSGAVVSRAFNYHEESWLRIFAERFDQATRAERGYDMTIRKASRKEESHFVHIITKHIKKQLDPSDDDLADLLDAHYEANKVYRVALHPEQPQENPGSAGGREHNDTVNLDASGSAAINSEPLETSARNPNISRSQRLKYTAVQYFIVSRPVAAPLSLAGRCTRGYWAVKIPDSTIGEKKYQIAFLKDTWRISAAGVEKEGEVYLELLDAEVPYISAVLCH